MDTPVDQQMGDELRRSLQVSMYEEAWRLYTLEDNLRHRRTALYLTIQTGILAFIGGTSIAFIPMIFDCSKPPEGRVAAVIAALSVYCGLCFVSWVGLKSWRQVLKAGKQWQDWRLQYARGLEIRAGFGPNRESVEGLAMNEHRWNEARKERRGSFVVNPDDGDEATIGVAGAGGTECALWILTALHAVPIVLAVYIVSLASWALIVFCRP